jgi:hypothetical protein
MYSRFELVLIFGSCVPKRPPPLFSILQHAGAVNGNAGAGEPATRKRAG